MMRQPSADDIPSWVCDITLDDVDNINYSA